MRIEGTTFLFFSLQASPVAVICTAQDVIPEPMMHAAMKHLKISLQVMNGVTYSIRQKSLE